MNRNFTFSLPLELLACTSPTNLRAFADWCITFIASRAVNNASLDLESARYARTKPEKYIGISYLFPSKSMDTSTQDGNTAVRPWYERRSARSS